MIPIINLSAARPELKEAREHPVRRLLKPVGGNDYVIEMDWSSIESFITCDRSAMWKLIYSRISKPRYALVYGRAIHRALELLYEAERNGIVPTDDAIVAQCESIFLEDPPDVGEWRTFERFIDTVQRYRSRYGNKEPFTVKQVETPFSVPLATMKVNQFLHWDYFVLTGIDDPEKKERFYVENIHVSWTGVIDLVVEEADKLWIVDHKTTSIEGDAFWRSFELSSQFLGYTWASQELLQRPVAGAIANVIYGRPMTKTGRSTDFMRRYYHYKPVHVAEWHMNIKSIIEDFVHHLVTKSFPMKTQWCSNKFGLCPYHDVCIMPPEHRLAMLMSNNYTWNRWNPLDT